MSTKDDIQFTIREQLIKKSTAFRQTITVAPNAPKKQNFSARPHKLHKCFINSQDCKKI
jgi:hypothetical protein